MAELASKDLSANLRLRPYRHEREEDEWTLSELEFAGAGKTLMATTLSLHDEDFGRLAETFATIETEDSPDATFVAVDYNLVVRITKAPSDDILVGFWAGEMYEWMAGYALVTTREALGNFAGELHQERETVVESGRLP